MKLVITQDAVGQILCHDITRIVKGVTKEAAFRKGHIITEEDIPMLLSMGKDNLYIWEKDETMLHENDAAEFLRRIAQGENNTEGNMHVTNVKEGKVELIADTDGVFLLDVERLRKVNSISELMVATIPANYIVRKGQRLAGMRVIPLVIKKEKLELARKAVGTEPLMKVIPFRSHKFGVVTTGNEVFHHRIIDTFTPTIVEKLQEYGCEMIAHELSDDDNTHIEACIKSMVENKDIELILCTGGMSVDPDDRTPLAIRNSGADIISYGAPVLPGAMFMIGYLPDGIPICGLPGCVMFSKRTIFDLVLPRVLAGIKITPEYLAGLGNGGLCQNCPECHFPNCSFGKGI
ncbi:molybdopterin-binding protein [Pleomorphochaeta sp. DL1XJH-081]|uniref:molybdopterin-binding protein n=1 Tax=Pleomorphochaeta sp. DL1XJH-081 TaxID=3409690 RepID=UPI003BB4AB61